MLADTTYASTVAGAIAPVITFIGLGVVGWVGHRLSRKLDRNNRTAVASLHEAKGEIRADLSNGIKFRLDGLERGQGELFEAIGRIDAKIDNLENDPPATIA